MPDHSGSPTLSDDYVTELIVSRTEEGHRLAAWILRDAVAAEDVVAEAALVAWRAEGAPRRAACR